MDNNTPTPHKWTYSSVGGAVRVIIRSGADIAHLGELDRKMWTVLSSPVSNLEFDPEMLSVLDSNGDGRIHVDEVTAAASWLTQVLKDPDSLLKGESSLPLSEFNEDSPEGLRLKKSAQQILRNLGLDKDSISVEDTADNTKVFADTRFNGDGIVTEASAGDDTGLAALIKTIAETLGGATDRSGAVGITQEMVDSFFASCSDYAAWHGSADTGTKPYGEDTADALAAVEALKGKVADFFMRCKLIGFDSDAAAAVDVDVEKIKAISQDDLGGSTSEIAAYPLARPNAEGRLPLRSGINPAWQAAFDKVRSLALDRDFGGRDFITESDWEGVLAKFAPFTAWMAEKKGQEVEALGIDAIKDILKEDRKADLDKLIAEDKALEEEALSIESVHKLLLLYRDFHSYLNNYVSFTDFYGEGTKAIFQAGELYIDQRRLDLCIKIEDMGKQEDMAALSWMYILYCACTSKTTGKGFNIAAVLTKGGIRNLRVGKNAIFYDREGEVYDATVIKIIDNPVSVGQAFWAPYRKFGQWLSDKFTKKVADKESQSFDSLTAKAQAVPTPTATDAAATTAGNAAATKPSGFDIAKFAGIFAAIGMAVAYLSQALVAIAKGAANLGLCKVLLVLLAILLVISGPSMILAWLRLRRRDLGPVLNANGWAVNASSYVSTKFGSHLTSLVSYPKLTAVDPNERRKRSRRRLTWTLIVLIVIAAVAYMAADRILLWF